MRYAILSDIHNETQALETVINHTKDQQIDGYFCLGDVGVDDCVDLIRGLNAPTVFGNWELSYWRLLNADNQVWVKALPALLKQEQFWLTHAGPFWPPYLSTLAKLLENRHSVPVGRLFPYLHFESDALWQTFTALTAAEMPLMFHGHTHRQLVWRFTADNYLQQLSQRTITLRAGDTLVVGVGSVGRPEDGPHASYVIYDTELQQIELIRVS